MTQYFYSLMYIIVWMTLKNSYNDSVEILCPVVTPHTITYRA